MTDAQPRYEHRYRGSYRAAVIGHTGRGNYGHGLDLAFWSGPSTPLYFLPRPFPLPGREQEWQRLEVPSEPPVAKPPLGAAAFFAANRALVMDLLEAVEEDRPTVADGHDARAALEMILAVYASHLSGQRVSLPLKERAHPLTVW